MNKEKFWKLVAIGLLLLNIVVLGFIFSKSNFMLEGKLLAHTIVSKLRLDKAQAATFMASVDKHRVASGILLEQEQEASKQLVLFLRTKQIDSLAYHQKSKELLEIRAKIVQNNFNHFHELRNICTPEQQKIFDENINIFLSNLNRQRLEK